MAEDSHVPPLPRRARGDTPRLGPGPPAGPLVLPEPVVQQILSVLDAIRAEASPHYRPARAERPAQDHPCPATPPASLPQRVPGTGTVREPPAPIAHPVPPARVPRLRSQQMPTAPLTAIAISRASEVTNQHTAEPDIAAQPGPVTAAPASDKVIPALPIPAKQRPDRPFRTGEIPASPRKAAPRQKGRPTRRGNVQARASKAQASHAEALTRPPKLARLRSRGGRHRGAASGVILVVILVCAASLGLLLSRHAAPAATASGHRISAGGETAIRNRAAAWVAGQVSRSAIVSCDPVMCQALETRGVPAASLLALGPGEADPLRSSIIVATAAARDLIGPRLSSAYAPAAIASFGSGSRQISVRVVAPRGAAAYISALRADMLARKTAGTQLLDNRRIIVSATARRQLARGQADSRLLVVIAGLAARWPVSVAAFGDLAPGASPGIPLRSADLAPVGATASAVTAAHMRAMVAFLRAQRDPYLAAHIQTVRRARGRYVLRIEFAAPSPPGLLGPHTP
jgi:hypothetical protein